ITRARSVYGTSPPFTQSANGSTTSEADQAIAATVAAPNTIHPKCFPRVPRAFYQCAKANTMTTVTTIQCRATSDAIEGAAIGSAPKQRQSTVGSWKTRRNSVRLSHFGQGSRELVPTRTTVESRPTTERSN